MCYFYQCCPHLAASGQDASGRELDLQWRGPSLVGRAQAQPPRQGCQPGYSAESSLLRHSDCMSWRTSSLGKLPLPADTQCMPVGHKRGTKPWGHMGPTERLGHQRQGVCPGAPNPRKTSGGEERGRGAPVSGVVAMARVLPMVGAGVVAAAVSPAQHAGTCQARRLWLSTRHADLRQGCPSTTVEWAQHWPYKIASY